MKMERDEEPAQLSCGWKARCGNVSGGCLSSDVSSCSLRQAFGRENGGHAMKWARRLQLVSVPLGFVPRVASAQTTNPPATLPPVFPSAGVPSPDAGGAGSSRLFSSWLWSSRSSRRWPSWSISGESERRRPSSSRRELVTCCSRIARSSAASCSRPSTFPSGAGLQPRSKCPEKYRRLGWSKGRSPSRRRLLRRSGRMSPLLIEWQLSHPRVDVPRNPRSSGLHRMTGRL